MKSLFENISYWRMALGRALLYMLIVGTIDFLKNTEEWSQVTWNDTGPFIIARLFLGTFVVMATVLIAFLDSTMTELRNKQNAIVESRTVSTTTIDQKEPVKEDT